MHNTMDLDAGSVAVVHTRTFVAGSAKRYSVVWSGSAIAVVHALLILRGNFVGIQRSTN
jgi:hypothetical protein